MYDCEGEGEVKALWLFILLTKSEVWVHYRQLGTLFIRLARLHRPHILFHIVLRYKYRCDINLSATWPKKSHYFVYQVSILNGFRADLGTEARERLKNTQEARAHHCGGVYHHRLIILKLITP